MEMKLLELMFYAFIAITGTLFVYITVIAVLFISHTRAERYTKN